MIGGKFLLLVSVCGCCLAATELVVKGEELIINGGFELDSDNNGVPDGWAKDPDVIYDVSETNARSGKSACLIGGELPDNREKRIRQYISVEKLKPNTQYRFSAWLKPAEKTGRVILQIAYYPKDATPDGEVSYNVKEAKGTEIVVYDMSDELPVISGYQEYSKVTTTPKFQLGQVVVYFWPISGEPYWVWVDDVSFKEVREISE